ncbi:hypothetical protein [Ochrovirga pacifica]|uniref:hypothetical protein n=1 Tax=Ochrovirga pacifica TaxID=1042376 RepID=UPI0002557B96|nr:hypothetical protein [Ochrovirga pacifica]
MKNKLIIALITLSAFVIGCTTGGYESPDDFSDVGFYNSEGNTQILQKNIYDYMTFSDLSIGATQHAWTIETGNAFLKGPISRVPTNLEGMIINEGDTVSNAKTVNVFFRKSGMQKVRLYNEFKDSVAFRGSRGGEDYDWPATKVGNKWVIDTTFVVKVFDTIIAELEVRQNDVVIDHKSTDTIYVEAGESLNFIDKTTIGEPTGRNFFVRTPVVPGDPSTGKNVANSSAEDATLLMKKLGVFEGGITANRTGETIPGDSDTYVFPAPIKVIPSSQPFQLAGSIYELPNETIRLPFNGEFVPATGQEAFFEVKVNGSVFAIESVTVNDTDATFLDIKLVDAIYRPDVITVTMLDGSDLESTDTRTPVAFVDEPVKMNDINLLVPDIAGLEQGSLWQPLDASVPITLSRSTEQAATGSYSLKVEVKPGTPNATWFLANLPEGLVLDPNKEYLLKYKVYVDPSSTSLPGEIGTWLLPNWTQRLWGNPSNFATGQWVEREQVLSGLTSLTIFRMRLIGTTSDAVFYFDDFFLQDIETRP